MRVFVYGSLMSDGWEQAFGGRLLGFATLRGYRRSFNKKSTSNWGTREHPGPTLGLEPDTEGICVGALFDLPDERADAVMTFLGEREGPSFGFPVYLVTLGDRTPIPAITPTNDRNRSTYIGDLSLSERAVMARLAVGSSGTGVDYVRIVRRTLGILGLRDSEVEDFWGAIEESQKMDQGQ